MRQCLPIFVCSLLALSLSTVPAFALEPLARHLESSEKKAFENREAQAVATQREDETSRAWFRLAPAFAVTATYTRNQYESVVRIPAGTEFRESVIVPNDQRDLYLNVTVPLVDVSSWERIGSAKRARDAAQAREKATVLDVKQRVASGYFNVVGAEAVLSSAKRSLEAAEKNLAYVKTRNAAGMAQELDVRRASAEVERNHQLVADGELQVAKSRRALETASGLAATAGAPELLSALEPEAPLASWLAIEPSTLPQVQAADAEARALRREASATRASLIPTINATGQERFTNAIGFGQAPYYAIGVSAQLKLDPTTFSNASAQSEAARAAEIRADYARRQAQDRIFDAWHETRAQIEKSRAARAEVEATALAAKVAKQRYESGTATFLDVVTVERDAFRSEVARISADASLAYARIALRLLSGRAPGAQ